jgi:hypothetical protein
MIILLSAGSNVKHETSSRQFKQVANMFALNDIPSLNVFHSYVLIWGWYGYINHYQRKSYIPKITESAYAFTFTMENIFQATL